MNRIWKSQREEIQSAYYLEIYGSTSQPSPFYYFYNILFLFKGNNIIKICSVTGYSISLGRGDFHFWQIVFMGQSKLTIKEQVQLMQFLPLKIYNKSYLVKSDGQENFLPSLKVEQMPRRLKINAGQSLFKIDSQSFSISYIVLQD